MKRIEQIIVTHPGRKTVTTRNGVKGTILETRIKSTTKPPNYQTFKRSKP